MEHEQELAERMRAEGIAELAVDTFLLHYRRLAAGERGTLGRAEIAPVETLPDADQLSTAHSRTGAEAARHTVLIKLNGGLGTSMGLERAKSLLPVRDGMSFLDLVARQVLALRSERAARVPLLLMNSFRTEEDSLAALARYPDLGVEGLPLSFLQHKVPKVLAGGLAAARHPQEPELEWTPPGHGDLYTALVTSGVLERLLADGFRHAFVSNADNLGAVLDEGILGWMVEQEADFVMEVADRTPADRKGGHLCRLRSGGRLALRESAQAPAAEQDEFQDIELYRYFNTNNLWLHLPSLKRLLDAHDGVLPLPTIVNRKHLDPRDPSSPAVIQLETAMGAAISLFERAAALRVSRRRFSPVKTTDDLLGVRSDAFRLSPDGRVTLVPEREAPPSIRLDAHYYKLIDDFEARFPAGPPSLRRAQSLVVEGDVTFGAGVVVEGDAAVRSTGGASGLPDGAHLSGEVVLQPT